LNPAPKPIVSTSSPRTTLHTDRMKTFTEAQVLAVKEINSEPIDTGFHAMWIRTKAAFAEKMTEDEMNEILKAEKPRSWLDDATAKYTAANIIKAHMK
jgi:hypothetical protein